MSPVYTRLGEMSPVHTRLGEMYSGKNVHHIYFFTPALVKCTPAKTFFCGWGTQKHEQGALRFLRSICAISMALGSLIITK